MKDEDPEDGGLRRTHVVQTDVGQSPVHTGSEGLHDPGSYAWRKPCGYRVPRRVRCAARVCARTWGDAGEAGLAPTVRMGVCVPGPAARLLRQWITVRSRAADAMNGVPTGTGYVRSASDTHVDTGRSCHSPRSGGVYAAMSHAAAHRRRGRGLAPTVRFAVGVRAGIDGTVTMDDVPGQDATGPSRCSFTYLTSRSPVRCAC